MVFALLLSGVFVLLSQWQLSRSTQHEPAEPSSVEDVRPLVDVLKPGQFFPGSVEDQMVTATGSYDPAKQVLVEGRLYDNRKGYWIVTAFAVDNAPKLKGVAASQQTWIPVARGWVAEPAEADAPPSGPLTLTGRLLASEAPVPNVDAGPGRASAVSVAELINKWGVSSYPGFIAATAEATPAGPVPANQAVRALNIPAQPPATQVNWLNLFYSVEWVVFAGFALYIWWRMVADDYRRDLEGDEDPDEDEYDDDFDDAPRQSGDAHQHDGQDHPSAQESQHTEPEHKVQP